MGVFDHFEGWIFIIIIAISVGGRVIRAINRKQGAGDDQQPVGQEKKNLMQQMSGQNAYSSATVDRRAGNDGSVTSRLAKLQAQLSATMEEEFGGKEKKERERREQQRKERERKLAETNRERERFAREQQKRLKEEELKIQTQQTVTRGAQSVVFNHREDLVKGIIMSEILGAPRGRRADNK